MINKTVKVSLLIGLIVSSTGCAGKSYPVAHENSIDENYHTYSFTADVRATHVIKREHGYVILAEPAPDAAFSHSDSQDLNMSLFGGFGGGGDESEKAGEGSSDESADIPLTGRTPYVLLARELLYRVGEMSVNTNATTEQYSAMMKEAFKVIQAVAVLEAPNIVHEERVTITTNETLSEIDEKSYSRTSSGTGGTGGGTTGSNTPPLTPGSPIPTGTVHNNRSGATCAWVAQGPCVVASDPPLTCTRY